MPGPYDVSRGELSDLLGDEPRYRVDQVWHALYALARVPAEMDRFITWFNDTAPGAAKSIKKAPVRSAIAEKVLSQGMGQPALLSLSTAIEKKKSDYYTALQQAQSGNEITEWIDYFVRAVLTAQTDAETLIDFTLKKPNTLTGGKTG